MAKTTTTESKARSDYLKARRAELRKAAKSKTHPGRRKETAGRNYPPNDGLRRVETEKVEHCQRCHGVFKVSAQKSVVNDDGVRKIVKARPGHSHYCKDCAKERLGELVRYDQRPKPKSKATKARESASRADSTKRAAAKPKARRKAAAAKPKRTPKAPTPESDPF